MIEIHGNINDLIANKEYKDFIESVPSKKFFLTSMIDAPIMLNGKVIGVINEIDFDEETWYGVVWRDLAIDIDVCREQICSLQLVK